MVNPGDAPHTVIRVIAEDREQTLIFDPSINLLTQLQSQGIYLPAICGGRGSCGKCKIKVVSGSLEPTAADRAYFSETDIALGFRLACTAYPVEKVEKTEPIAIIIPEVDETDFAGVKRFETQDTALNNVRCEGLLVQRKALSFARQVQQGDQPVSLSALKEIAKLADITGTQGGAETSFYIYRDKNAIVHISDTPKDLYAIGIDIGTTTIVFALVNLQSGKTLGSLSLVNKQREFGGDVISRIQRANQGDLPLLSQRVRKQIAEGIAALCRDCSINGRDVCKIAVAANTTMLHLLLGLSCQTLGQYPFTPITLDFVSCVYGELFEGELSCEVVILPGISTYVGADIVAGILFSELYQSQEPVLFMDIGTNGEMALCLSGKIICTATAAGPAFEGGNILWGIGSVPGAIASVKYRDGKFEADTIGNRPPLGICGSGVVDTVAEGLRHDLILPSGRFNQERSIRELFLARTQDEQDIIFCQKDVRELQLAKSAIYSGIDAMLHHCSLGYDAIKTLYIAGGFGYNLNFASASAIGLIPAALVSKVVLIGNSSLGGTVKYLLNSAYREDLQKIRDMAEECKLPNDRYFNQIFLENINFDEPG